MILLWKEQNQETYDLTYPLAFPPQVYRVGGDPLLKLYKVNQLQRKGKGTNSDWAFLTNVPLFQPHNHLLRQALSTFLNRKETGFPKVRLYI